MLHHPARGKAATQPRHRRHPADAERATNEAERRPEERCRRGEGGLSGEGPHGAAPREVADDSEGKVAGDGGGDGGDEGLEVLQAVRVDHFAGEERAPDWLAEKGGEASAHPAQSEHEHLRLRQCEPLRREGGETAADRDERRLGAEARA